MMIHYTPEGNIPKLGLNIAIGATWRKPFVVFGKTWYKPWISFRWVWYDPMTGTMSSRRLRIRPYMRPFILTSTDRVNVVDSWLWNHDHIAVPREIIEDECHIPAVIKNIYKKTNYAEYVKRYRA